MCQQRNRMGLESLSLSHVILNICLKSQGERYVYKQYMITKILIWSFVFRIVLCMLIPPPAHRHTQKPLFILPFQNLSTPAATDVTKPFTWSFHFLFLYWLGFLILVNPFKHFLQLFTFNKVVSSNIKQISGFAMGKIFSDALEYLMAGGYFYCGCLSWCVCLYLGRRLSLACCHMMKEILPCFKKFCCLWWWTCFLLLSETWFTHDRMLSDMSSCPSHI